MNYVTVFGHTLDPKHIIGVGPLMNRIKLSQLEIPNTRQPYFLLLLKHYSFEISIDFCSLGANDEEYYKKDRDRYKAFTDEYDGLAAMVRELLRNREADQEAAVV